jgi:hypothetical protein
MRVDYEDKALGALVAMSPRAFCDSVCGLLSEYTSEQAGNA